MTLGAQSAWRSSCAVFIPHLCPSLALASRRRQNLVSLNFNQEAREADLRYGLVRVRENAEGIAFYGGEASEMRALTQVGVLSRN